MITALLVATRDIIRSNIRLQPEDCLVQNDARPTPACGPLFISVYGSSWSPDIIDQNLGIDERADISITITRRLSATPYDMRGDAIYVEGSLAVENIANVIKRSVHQNYTLITNANALLDGTDKIMEPLRWLGGDATPSIVDNEWFSSTEENVYSGIVFTINFGRARRMQTITNIR
jgi:hypothetical protein